VTAAEIGRAHFHLGQYRQAHSAFRQAVVLRPQRVESAIYLLATSFLIGDRVQALTILEALLQGGAKDLYLAVSLSGEQRFLADPGVRTLLERHAIELAIDPGLGTVNGVTIGSPRNAVVEAFDVPESQRQADNFSAAAGPGVIWAFTFDDQHRLREMAIDVDRLMRYTPYRLRLVSHPDWIPTPASTLAALGPPLESRANGTQLSSSWAFGHHVVTMEFSSLARSTHFGLADGAASLHWLQLSRGASPSPDRMSR
jgi:tetratricopeptide (TPR) repeat protein